MCGFEVGLSVALQRFPSAPTHFCIAPSLIAHFPTNGLPHAANPTPTQPPNPNPHHQVDDVPLQRDPDPDIESEIFETRQAFLSLCQVRAHWGRIGGALGVHWVAEGLLFAWGSLPPPHPHLQLPKPTQFSPNAPPMRAQCAGKPLPVRLAPARQAQQHDGPLPPPQPQCACVGLHLQQVRAGDRAGHRVQVYRCARWGLVIGFGGLGFGGGLGQVCVLVGAVCVPLYPPPPPIIKPS